MYKKEAFVNNYVQIINLSYVYQTLMDIHTQRTCVYTAFTQCITKKVRLIACHFRTEASTS